jgi:OOP family OmpA-OmpF porin
MRYFFVICVALAGCAREAPTVTLAANPSSLEQSQCATLTWSSTNAATVSIDQGVGPVDQSGSKEVCPQSSTQYTVTAAGESGSRTASSIVNVTPQVAAQPVASLPVTKLMVFPEAALFESGKSELKPAGKVKITEYREQAKDELSHAEHVMISGYTDNVGETKSNSTLSLKRAEAVRDHLVSLGADAKKFEVTGAGESNPIADNKTKEGRAKNRRVEVAVVGK